MAKMTIISSIVDNVTDSTVMKQINNFDVVGHHQNGYIFRCPPLASGHIELQQQGENENDS